MSYRITLAGQDMAEENLIIYGACGVLSGLLYTAAYAVGAALRPDHSSVRQAVSELIESGAPNKRLLDGMIFGFHALVIPFAYGLHRAIGGGRGSRTGPVLLASAGVLGVILTAFFSCDPGCEPVTARGLLHILISIPRGFLILFSIRAFSSRLRQARGWDGYGTYSRITFLSGIPMALLTVVFGKSSIGGPLERILTLVYQQWYVAMGIALLRR